MHGPLLLAVSALVAFASVEAHQLSLPRLHIHHQPLPSALDSSVSLEGWMDVAYNKSVSSLFAAISPPGAARGAIMASPSTQHPDYYYHWVRDSSLTMDVVVRLLGDATTMPERDRLISTISDFGNFTKRLQQTPNPSGSYGEPKWHMNGTAFLSKWGRPQNDGPAIRAYVLTEYVQYLSHVWINYTSVFNPDLAAKSPVKEDLEFVAHHWRESSYEIWEEVKGTHLYTLMVQRRALLDGARMAEKLEDPKAAAFYVTQAREIEGVLRSFWDAEKGYLVVTKDRVDGFGYKDSGLDIQVILASLHASLAPDHFLTPESDEMVATLYALIRSFSSLYPINKANADKAPAMGRYPEDLYNGYDADHVGNPWMLATAAAAESLYRMRLAWQRQGQIAISTLNAPFLAYITDGQVKGQVGTTLGASSPAYRTILEALLRKGDAFLARVRYHSPTDLSLSEQWNRLTGFQQGAPDLTWSYAALITAVRTRRDIIALPMAKA